MNKIALTSEPSIQHGLEIALQTLKMIPAHASREILLIMGSLTTCDAGDINETIEVREIYKLLQKVFFITFSFAVVKARKHSLFSD